MKRTIEKIADKVRMYFGLSVPISSEQLVEVSRKFNIETNLPITNFERFELAQRIGALILQIDHKVHQEFAASLLVPVDDLDHYLIYMDDNETLQDAADYFGVTPKVIEFKKRIYRL